MQNIIQNIILDIIYIQANLCHLKIKKIILPKTFSNRQQLLKWCEREDSEIVKEYILKLLKEELKRKIYQELPSHLELKTSELPTIDLYKKHFGSYSKACELASVKPMFGSGLPKEWVNPVDKDLKIFIDTREQQPLNFSNSEFLKLDFGDYAVGKEHYDYTYVDRKSETDFKSTLSKNNLKRFRAELERTKKFDSYLFIVTETDMSTMESRNRWSPPYFKYEIYIS